MHRYIIKRLLMLIPVIIGVSFAIYFIMDLAPGDVISQIGSDATEQQIQELRHRLGYDRSVLYRYARYMTGLVHGDLGRSLLTGQPVWDMYTERLPATLKLAFSAMLVANLISIPLGILSAVRRGTVWDNAGMLLALLGLSMPHFWLGLLLIIAFSLGLGWFPSGGDTGFMSIILPAITIGTGNTAVMTRTTRSSMIDAIHQDFLRTARAKGVPERQVIRRHAFKNALIPIITIVGTQLSVSLGGSILTETVFAWPGVGRLIIESVNQRDVPTVTGSIILTTILISVMLLIIDLLYAYVDPRIKAQYISKRKG